MDGSDKRRLTLVGKSMRPRCFPKDLSKLPLRYYNSSNAWMTGALFEKDLLEWDRELRLANRKILCLVDNCSAHPERLKQVLTIPGSVAKLIVMAPGKLHTEPIYTRAAAGPARARHFGCTFT